MSDEAREAPVVKEPSSGSFWAGIFLGCLVAIISIGGLGYYWYRSGNPYFQRLVDAQTGRLDTLLENQSIEFQGLLNELSERQKKSFDQILRQAQDKFDGQAISFEKTLAGRFEKQTRRFDQMLEEAETKLGEGFDARLARLIEKELETVINKRQTARTEMAAGALKNALDRLEEGEVSNAGLFFSNAVQHAPDNWKYIEEYSTALLQWTGNKDNPADLESRIDVLSDLETFLDSRFVYLPPEHLEDVRKMLGKIADNRELLVSKQDDERKLWQRAAMSDAEKLLESQAPTTTENIERQLEYIETVLPAYYERGETGGQQYQKLIRRQEDLTRSLQIVRLLDDVRKGLERSRNSDLDRQIRLAHIAHARSMIGPLILAIDEVPRALHARVRTSNTDVENEAVRISEEILTGVEKEIENNEFRAGSAKCMSPGLKRCSSAIDSLEDLHRQLSLDASQIPDSEVAEVAAKHLGDVLKNIQAWAEAQRRAYNHWAITEVDRLYRREQRERGMISGPEEIDLAGWMQDYLAPIDHRFLDNAVRQAYNEVFGLYYAGLDTDLKMSVSEYIAMAEKKPLTDF